MLLPQEAKIHLLSCFHVSFVISGKQSFSSELPISSKHKAIHSLPPFLFRIPYFLSLNPCSVYPVLFSVPLSMSLYILFNSIQAIFSQWFCLIYSVLQGLLIMILLVNFMYFLFILFYILHFFFYTFYVFIICLLQLTCFHRKPQLHLSYRNGGFWVCCHELPSPVNIIEAAKTFNISIEVLNIFLSLQ